MINSTKQYKPLNHFRNSGSLKTILEVILRQNITVKFSLIKPNDILLL